MFPIRITPLIALIAFVFMGSVSTAQTVYDEPTITGYELTDRERVSRSDYLYTFKATAQNTNTVDMIGVTGTAACSSTTATLVDNELTFGTIDAGTSVESEDTFSIRINRRYEFDDSSVTWSFDYTDPNDIDDDGDGYSRNDGDCDDDNAEIHPDATEICNGIDDDCDGEVDEDDVCGVSETPNPEEVAPPLSTTGTTGFFDQIYFLFAGSDPIQTGMTEGEIDEERVAVIRGIVKDQTNSPLEGVEVTILNHPEYGQTLSRSDGEYDLVVNGGGGYTLNFRKSGYLTAQRNIDPDWQDYAWADDVVLIPVSGPLNPVQFGGAGAQIALGKEETDDSGIRKAVLYIPGSTGATMHFEDGSTGNITFANITITEYTVGDLGSEAMPAELPASSAYTYAAEFRVEEAVTAGATSVTFDQPLYGYVENFLGFSTGTPVPAGYYDRSAGAWIPTEDGQVIEIMGITGGAADIDADGDGGVDNGIFYADTPDEGYVEIDLGITDEERQQLATLYAVGQTIWRVPIQHFSPYDLNFPYSFTTSSGSSAYPTMPAPTHGTVPTDTPATVDDYGTIDIQNQVFRESLGLSGTPFTINYSSERVDGNTSAATINIPLTGDTLPAEIPKDVKVRITTAGQRHVYSVVESGQAVSTNLSYSYEWNGEDAYGRKVTGEVPMKIDLSYVYQGYYSIPQRFAKWFSFSLPGNEEGTAFIPAREDVIRKQYFNTSVDASKLWYAKEQAIGGWTIDAHHAYDPGGRTLYLGDGSSYRADNYAVGTLQRLAGTNTSSDSTGDGGSALAATFSDGIGFAMGPDGSIYFTDACKIRKIDPDGIITTIAGQDYCGYDGDGGSAVDASFSDPMGLDVGPDGSLYVADSNNGVIRKITPDGYISTVAGDYDYEFEFVGREDSGSEFDIRLAFKKPKAFLRWALVKVTSNFPVKEALAAISIGDYDDFGDGGPATEAYLDYPVGVAVDTDGSFYIAEMFSIRKVDPNGIITTYAGSGDNDSDWIPAVDTSISYTQGIALGPDGSVYYSEASYWRSRIRRILPNGIVTTIAGTSSNGITGDGGLATEAMINYPGNIVVSDEGIVYFSEDNNLGRVRKINGRGILSTVIGGGSTPFVDAEGAPSVSIDFSDYAFYIVPALDPDGGLIFRVAYVPPYGGSLDEGWNSIWKLNESALLGNDANSDVAIPNRSGTGLYIFDSGGMHLETRNALTGAVTLSFNYDGDDRLVAITDADGNITTIERDGVGNPTGIVAAGGQRTELSLDANGYLATLANPANQTVSFDYTSGGLLTGMTRPKGNTYAFEYDSLGRLERAVKPDGSYDALTRNSVNDEDVRSFEVVKTNRMGHQTTYRTEYLTDGAVQNTVIRPDGLETTTLRKPDGSEEYTTPDGVVTTITRTPGPRFGMLVPVLSNVTVTTPGGVETVMEGARETTLLDESDITSVSSLINTTTVNGRVFTEIYDGATRQYTRTTPTGRTSTMTIDGVGRIIGSKTGDFDDVTYSYLSDGKLSSIARGDRFAQYGYDALNNLNRITNAFGDPVTFSHTDAGKIDTATDALGNTSDLNYGTNGRTTGITTPRGHLHQFGYNDVDMMESYTDPDGYFATYQYNDEHGMERITLADGGEITFGYDTAGRTVSMTDPSGIVTTGSYDGTGRLISVERSGEAVTFSYDGYLATQVDMSGSVEESIGIAYNDNILRDSVSLAGETISYVYDNDGLVTQAGDMTVSRNAENGLVKAITLGQFTIDLEYNSFGEPTLYSLSNSGTEIYSEDYTWNELRRIVDKNVFFDTETVSYGYTYDAVGQLTGVDRDGTAVEDYSYDANHNRSGTTAVYDKQDRLASCDGVTYSYSDNGFLTTSVVDATAETTTYDYTVTGELTTVVLGDGTTINYTYDGLGRRIQKEVSGFDPQKFLYLDELGPIAELDASNNVVSRFVYATWNNVPDYMIRGGVHYLLVKDQVGSVRMVVDTGTGSIVQKIDYDSFGQVTQDTNPGFQPFGFAGGMYDPDTGLVRFGRRDYDPSIGRWTAKDPIRFAGGTTNLYAYAGNDPVSRRDPTGLKSSESTYSDVVGVADEVSNYTGLGLDGLEQVAKNVAKNEIGAEAMGKTGDAFGFVSTTTSFLKYIDTANAYYYDGKGSLGDVAHDFGSFANNAIGLIPYPPTKAATKAIGYIDTFSTPILTSLFTNYYIQQSSGLPPGASQAMTPGNTTGYGNIKE